MFVKFLFTFLHLKYSEEEKFSNAQLCTRVRKNDPYVSIYSDGYAHTGRKSVRAGLIFS